MKTRFQLLLLFGLLVLLAWVRSTGAVAANQKDELAALDTEIANDQEESAL